MDATPTEALTQWQARNHEDLVLDERLMKKFKKHGEPPRCINFNTCSIVNS